MDDVFYFDESPFQDGPVAQAVNSVVASGAYYFSSAGNEGNLTDGTSGTFEGDFVPLPPGSPLPMFAAAVHNFGTTASPVSYDTITAVGQTAVLFWADPMGASTNDYDLYEVNNTGTATVAASTNLQTGSQNPYEQMTLSGADDRIIVAQKTGAAIRAFHLGNIRGTLSVATNGETHGHGAASSAYTVAATPAAVAFTSGYPTGPYPGTFVNSNRAEPYTSDGPRRMFFNADSTPITPGNLLFGTNGGSVLNKPDFTAADGVSVTGVGGFSVPFYGTSAAAPAAASIAALLLSAKPTITATQMRTALTSTALDIEGAGFDNISGYGILQALQAVQSLGASGTANPSFGTITATENPGNGNGVIEAGEGALLTIQLQNTTGAQAATGISATLTSSTPGVIIMQPAVSVYADMAIGAGPENNLSPFAFALPTNFGCGKLVQFSLNISFNSGQTRVLNFAVQTGMVSITNTLGSTPTVPSGITFTTGTENSRLSRNSVASACGTTKTNPGAVAGANHVYDSYSFASCSATCFDPQLVAGSAGINLLETLYSPSFIPTSVSSNYSGDPGTSNATQNFGVTLAASTNYSVVVADVNGNPPSTNIPNTYTIQIPTCAFSCNSYPLPVALVQNVTVTAAAPGGTASASIDNGSNDPNHGPVTITQSPAGPYSTGVTPVTLTITNKFGAFAQATANVTVNSPGATPSVITWTPSSHTGYLNTAIGSGVLNASTATTTGTFTYTATNSVPTTVAITSASGLALGTYTLTATFVPTDTTHYATATSTTSFTVVNQEVFVMLSGGSTASFYDSGTVQSSATSGGGIGAAVDANGNVWSINSSGTSVARFTDVGALSFTLSGAGISSAKSLAVDGNNLIWIANGNGTLSVITNTGAAVFTTPIDPAGNTSAPGSISVDTAGSLWLSIPGSNNIIEVIGAAGPVSTPTVTQVINSAPGTKP